MSSDTTIEPNRREFVATIAVAAAVALPVLNARAADESAHEAAPATAPADEKWIPTIKPADLKDGTFYDKFGKDRAGFVLARDGNTVYAINPKCTHKGCVVNAATNGLQCKCHGARYDLSGEVTKGPARKALARYPLRLSKAGLIEVNTAALIDDHDDSGVLSLQKNNDTPTTKP